MYVYMHKFTDQQN